MTERTNTPKEIPQFSLPQILFMYAWPIAWFMFLIYVVGPIFVTPNGTFPLWAENLIGLLGNGAEITVAILILRREGYRLTFKDLRTRINLRFPDKLWKWGACFGAFVLAFVAVLALLPLEAQIATLLPPPRLDAGASPERGDCHIRPADRSGLNRSCPILDL